MLTYDMEARGGASMYEHLYRCLRGDIESGRIAPHEKLPSKRALAKHLGTSVITVEGAYSQLIAEGYAYALERRGYFACEVAPALAPVSAAACAKDPASPVCAGSLCADLACISSFSGADDAPSVFDLTGATAAAGVFPYKAWARTVREVVSAESERGLVRASEPTGALALRSAIAVYLRGSRGMSVSPDQIVVGAGAQTLYALIVQLLGRSARFAVENPGYPRLARIYRSNDVALSYVPLDDQGVSPEALRLCGANVLHCMPSHQLPTGLVMPAPRRFELLRWAAEGEGRYIIEDDYDCEFRMTGRPVPALQSIDAHERVIYANTFTKSLGRALRIGYMVLPPHLARIYEQRLGFYSCTVGTIDQLVLAKLIESGEYERHVSRLRTRYRRVQEAFIARLRESCAGSRLRFRNVGAGLHFVMEADLPAAEDAVCASARAHGVLMAPMSRYAMGDAACSGACACAPHEAPSFLVDVTGLDAQSAPAAAAALGRALGELLSAER